MTESTSTPTGPKRWAVEWYVTVSEDLDPVADGYRCTYHQTKKEAEKEADRRLATIRLSPAKYQWHVVMIQFQRLVSYDDCPGMVEWEDVGDPFEIG